MGEFLPDPHQNSKGASADTGKYLQAVALAGQLGKTVEEVLAFMGTASTQPVIAPVVQQPVIKEVKPPVEEPIVFETDVKETPVKSALKKQEPVPDADGFVVTETIDPEDASSADLDRITPDADDSNDWSGKIREGSRVEVVYQVSASKIDFTGKKGKVIRVIGSEAAKVYEVEFAAGKVQKVRLNKKTGKLEKGYVTKKFQGTFSEDQVKRCD